MTNEKGKTKGITKHTKTGSVLVCVYKIRPILVCVYNRRSILLFRSFRSATMTFECCLSAQVNLLACYVFDVARTNKLLATHQ